VIETHPGTTPYPLHGLVVLESHNDPIHRDIIENNYVNYRDKKKKIEIPMIPPESTEI
jgi:hypothetical protein